MRQMHDGKNQIETIMWRVFQLICALGMMLRKHCARNGTINEVGISDRK